MRFLELRLMAFGPFSGVTLPFGDPPSALHVVYGPNEAGKSTTLRAITDFLYGVPKQTGDAHVHGYEDLRIGARLLDHSRVEHDLVRRKGVRNTLARPDGEVVLDSALADMLGGISRDLYTTMFALNHESLRRGAEALLAGEGEIGATLHDAGLGGGSVLELVKRLRSDAEALFKPKAPTTKINLLVAEYKEATARVQSHVRTPATWKSQVDQIEETRARRDRLDAVLRDLREEHAQLDRSKRIHPKTVELARLRTERATMGLPPTFPADLAARLSKIEQALRDATREVNRLEMHRGDLERAKEGLPTSTEAASPETRHADLEAVLASTRPLAASAARLAQIEAELARSAASIAQRTKALGRFQGSVDALVALPLPCQETLGLFEHEWERLAQERLNADTRRRAADESLARLTRDLRELLADGDLPSEEDLLEARSRRDQGLALLKATVRGDEPPSEIAAYAKGESLAEAFEHALRRADALVDRLRTEGARAAELARAKAEHARLADEQRTIVAELEQLQVRQRDLETRWHAQWTKVSPLSPKEMREWLVRVAEILQALERERALRTESDALQRQREAAEASLRKVVEPTDTSSSLEVLTHKAEALLKRGTDARRRHELIEEKLRAHAAETSRTDTKITHAKREMLEKQIALHSLLAGVDLETPEAVRKAQARADQCARLDEQIRACEAFIADMSVGGASSAAPFDPILDARRLDEMERQIEETEEERRNANMHLGRIEQGLKEHFSGDADAAAASEDAAAALATLRTHVERYLRSMIAAKLLEGELERFRGEFQGPVLAHTSELFANLTSGRFASLRVELGDQEELVLRCVRDDGRSCAMAELSDGTRDQLYLALRIASLANHFETSRPLPVVLDDIFVHFDDERTRAGLEALATLAKSTQVILFTHHTRVVDLAEQALSPARLRVHRLDVLSTNSAVGEKQRHHQPGSIDVI